MLKTEVRQEQGVQIVTLRGRITMGAGNKALHELVDELLVEGNRRILLNVEGVTFIDSTGLGELVSSLRTVEGMGGSLGLVCPEGAVYNALSMARLVPVFQVFSHEAEAVREFAGTEELPGDHGEVLYEKEAGVAVITLNRPRQLNALTRLLLEELRNAVALAGHDPAVHAIVVTGAGRAFSIGADIEELKGGDSVFEALDLFQQTILALADMGKPVIAAVNGFATGAGLDLALACDLRVVSDRAKLSSAFIRFGLVPDGGSTLLLQQLVGRGRAFELIATGRALDAREAAAWGLANRVAAHPDTLAEARAWAAELATGPRRALGRVKQLVVDGSNLSLSDALAAEREAQAACLKDAEFEEGVEARLARRDPDFTDL